MTTEELRDDYSRIMLDCLVPLEVQAKIPGVRTLWFELLLEEPVALMFNTAYQAAIKSRLIASEAVRLGMIHNDPSVRGVAYAFYNKLVEDRMIVSQIIGRVWTEGNEQCPYWGRYDRPPLEADRR